MSGDMDLPTNSKYQAEVSEYACYILHMPGSQGYPTPLREQHPCQSNRKCPFRTFWMDLCMHTVQDLNSLTRFRNFWNHVLLCPLQIPPHPVRATLGVVSVKFWDFSVALAKGGGVISLTCLHEMGKRFVLASDLLRATCRPSL